MSLITCPDCGHKVSHLAASCPRCGRPVSTIPPSSQPEIGLPSGVRVETQDGEDILVSNRQTQLRQRDARRAQRFPWAALFLIILVGLLVAGAALLHASRHSQEVAKRVAVASRAIEAVGKMDAALDVGINFQSYSTKLQDAAAAVSSFEPDDGTGKKIKESLEKAVLYHKAAKDAWNADIDSKRGITSKAWYWLRDYPELDLGVSSEWEDVDADVVRQAAWTVAGQAYEKAKTSAAAYDD